MSRLLASVCFAVLLSPSLCYAANEFDGTWKTDPKSWKMISVDEYLLKDGHYACMSGCEVKQSIPADGAFHAVTGSLYIDAMSVTPLNDRTVHIESRKDGKKVGDTVLTANPDEKTITIKFVAASNTNGGPPVTGTAVETRIGEAPSGAHAISGKWQFNGASNLSQNAATVTYKLDGNALTMTQPTGQSYTAVLDGPQAAYKGDPGINLVSVKRVGPHAVEETDRLNGKTVWVGTSTISGDGKNMTTVWEDLRSGERGSFSSVKE